MIMQVPILEPAPSSPMRPEAWSDDVHEAAKAHTAACYPNEAAGMVEGGAFVPLENLSQDPKNDVVLSDADLLRVADADVFFHSHPDTPASPTADDMRYQQQLGIPFVIMSWPYYDVAWWGDSLPRAPLLGRGFRHGIHDCYSLVRDYYADKGVSLPDFPREWNWWADEKAGGKGLDLYRDGFEKAGFQQIDIREATKPGDGLLMAFSYKVPMHAALVWDRDLLIQHAAGTKSVDPTRLSTLVPRSRYMRLVTMAVRRP
jgi:cell wall-associated NlpC family hydrolase